MVELSLFKRPHLLLKTCVSVQIILGLLNTVNCIQNTALQFHCSLSNLKQV